MAVLSVILTSCNSATNSLADKPGAKPMSIILTSSAFKNGETIPEKYTYNGGNISPELSWDSIPEGTKSFALIADDPDAPRGTWVHWVIYNLPAGSKELQEHVSKAESMQNGSKQGINDFGKTGYDGPCPPPGSPHHYYFKLYALDCKLGLKSNAKKSDLVDAMKGHILGQGEIIGKYGSK